MTECSTYFIDTPNINVTHIYYHDNNFAVNGVWHHENNNEVYDNYNNT